MTARAARLASDVVQKRDGDTEAGPKFVTVAGFMKTHSVGRSRTYELLNQGKLKAVHLGKRTLISIESIETFFASLPKYQPQMTK